MRRGEDDHGRPVSIDSTVRKVNHANQARRLPAQRRGYQPNVGLSQGRSYSFRILATCNSLKERRDVLSESYDCNE